MAASSPPMTHFTQFERTSDLYSRLPGCWSQRQRTPGGKCTGRTPGCCYILLKGGSDGGSALHIHLRLQSQTESRVTHNYTIGSVCLPLTEDSNHYPHTHTQHSTAKPLSVCALACACIVHSRYGAISCYYRKHPTDDCHAYKRGG